MPTTASRDLRVPGEAVAPADRRLWTTSAWLGLAAILVFAALLRAYLFRGFVGLDDGEYARLAHQVAAGTFHPAEYTGPAVFPLRVGVFVPTGAMFRLMGVSELSLVIYPFILSLAMIALGYVCAGLLFGRRAGLIAAAVLAVFPPDVENATKLLPDLPAAFFAAAGVTVLIAVAHRLPRRSGIVFAGGAAAGVLLGASWLTKESVAHLAPFCLVLLVLTLRTGERRMWLLWAGLAAGALPVLAIEMLAYYRLNGDLLFRLHELERNYQQNAKYFFTEGSEFGWKAGDSYGRALFKRWFVSGPSMLLLSRAFLFVPLIGLVATIYAWWRRDRAFLFVSIWLWSVLLMANFGSTSLRTYLPLPLFFRYLYLVFFPAVVVVAGLIARTFPWDGPAGIRRAATPALLGIAAALVVFGTGARETLLSARYPSRWLDDIRAVHPMVTQSTRLYTDTLSLRALEFLAGYPENAPWTDFENVSSADAIPAGSVVVVNKPYIGWLDRHGGVWGSRQSGYARHDFFAAPPPSWTARWRNDTTAMYVVGERIAQQRRKATY